MSGLDVHVRSMRPDDWPRVERIYVEGIESGVATFETEAPTWQRWDAAHRADCRLVAEVDGVVVGWAALTPFSPRHVYRGVAELSIYVASAHRGRGVGRVLLQRLVDESERAGIWTLLAGIFPVNEASLALHRALGFRTLGVHVRLGRATREWRDVVLLERRSEVVGID